MARQPLTAPQPVAFVDNTKPLFSDSMIHPSAYEVTGNGYGSLRRVVRQHHASVDHALAYVAEKRAAGELWYHDYNNRIQGVGDRAPQHIARWEKACGIIKSGWPEGAERIGTLAETIKTSLPEGRKVFRRNYREGGAYPAIPRYLAGDPRCMVDSSRAKGGSKVLTLLVDCNGGSSTGEAALEGRAAACMAVADVLEKAGWALEIIAFEMSNGGVGARGQSEAVEIAVSAKKAGEPIDPLRLAFTLGHTEFLRGFLFTLDGCNKNQQDVFNAGGTDIGFVAMLPSTVAPAFIPENTYYIRNASNYQWDGTLPAGLDGTEARGVGVARAILADLAAQKCPGIETGD